MEDMDFCVTGISRIIQRPSAAGWAVENLRYEDEFVVVVVLDGEIEYRIDGDTIVAHKHDLLIFPPGVVRSGKTSVQNPWSFVSILYRMDEPGQDYFGRSIMVFREVNDSIVRYFLEAAKVWMGKNPLYRVKCNVLTTQILHDCVLSQMPYQKVPHIAKLEKVRLYIQEHFREDISVEKLAESVHMSVSYFRRLFHHAYGYSPMQYIVNLRIENARDLLMSGEVNVSEAAQLSGFDDIYYFSTLFKRKTGFAPTKLLQMQQ